MERVIGFLNSFSHNIYYTYECCSLIALLNQLHANQYVRSDESRLCLFSKQQILNVSFRNAETNAGDRLMRL